ncbi:MAG: hypothetical protein GF401_13940 [Chitinivibrionales bacterium]|nr:hypothetical protein [Chitinivibrionales bacterium]
MTNGYSHNQKGTSSLHSMALIAGAVVSFLIPGRAHAAKTGDYFSPSERARIQAGTAIETVYTSKEISSEALPPPLKNRSFDYAVFLKGEIQTDVSLLSIANVFLDISSMKGIHYYSVTQDKILPLIEESYTITDSNFSQPIPNHQFTEQVPEFDFCFFQKDNRSGGLFYHSKIAFQDSSLIFEISNVDTVRRFLIFLIYPDDVYRYVRLFPTENGYLYYIVMLAVIPHFAPRPKTAKDSFLNRARAMKDFYWKAIRGKRDEKLRE